MKFAVKTLLFVVVVFIFITSFSSKVSSFMEKRTEEPLVYLIAGLDDVAQNADVIFLLTYNAEDNTAAVVQIPRDTYLDFGNSQNKINHIYASFRSKGFSEKESMDKTSDIVSKNLGIEIDGYLSFTISAFRNIVDSIGGVVIDIPEDFYCADGCENQGLYLSKGENLLDGKKAEVFVRYRKGYALGDLGRLDAQKIFLNGLYHTIKNRLGITDFIKLLSVLDSGIITNVSFMDAAKLFLIRKTNVDDLKIVYLTLPGKALFADSGIWYYVLNKNSVEGVLVKYFRKRFNKFDSALNFVKSEDAAFSNVYFDNDFSYREYSEEEILDMNIIKKQ